MRAITGAPAALLDVLNGRTAFDTRFAFSAVNGEIFPVAPFSAAAVDEVANRRAAVRNSFRKNRLYGFMQSDKTLFRHAAAAAGRADTGEKQRLVRINVAESRNHGLIQQKAFTVRPDFFKRGHI